MEGFKVNRPLSGSLVYDRIMPVAKRLPSRFHSCPLSARLSQATFFCGQSLIRGNRPAAERGLLSTYTIGLVKNSLLSCFHQLLSILCVLL